MSAQINCQHLEPVQERLAALWSELLGVEPQPSGDLFLLGGHSLLATHLTSRVRAHAEGRIQVGVAARLLALVKAAHADAHRSARAERVTPQHPRERHQDFQAADGGAEHPP